MGWGLGALHHLDALTSLSVTDGELHPASRHHQGLLYGVLLSRRQATRLALHSQPVWQREPEGHRRVSSPGWAEVGSLSFREGGLGCRPVDGHSCARKPLSSTVQAAGVRTHHPPCSSLPSVVPAGQWKHVWRRCIMSSRHDGALYSPWEAGRPYGHQPAHGCPATLPQEFLPLGLLVAHRRS